MNIRVKALARALRDKRTVLIFEDYAWQPLDLPRSAILKHVRTLPDMGGVSIRPLSRQDRGLSEYITTEERHAESKAQSINFAFCDALRWFDELSHPAEVKELLIKHFTGQTCNSL
jgi:DNA-binding transcriptional ArsR family regulator